MLLDKLDHFCSECGNYISPENPKHLYGEWVSNHLFKSTIYLTEIYSRYNVTYAVAEFI